MASNHITSALIGRSFNGYRVERYIARGGMGLVFEGVQESLNRPVALKFLYPHLSGDDRFRERFEREAKAIAQLSHPNIVRVLDYGVDDTYYYMVLDYIDGSSLRDRLESLHAQGRTLGTDSIIDIIQQVGSALSYAHGLGFVHRDVKPGNIMLGKDGRAYLTDFGIVKLLGSEQFTVTGAFLGTPEYMSPEQATGGEIGPATDLYALAIAAYELLVGRVPFKASTPLNVMQKQLNEPLPLPSTLAPQYAHGIDAIFSRALAKRPGERYASIREFVDDLVRALRSNPQTAGNSIPTLIAGPSALLHHQTPSAQASSEMLAAFPTSPSMSSHPQSAPYPAPPTNQSYGTTPPSYGDPPSAYGAGGTLPPPGPPAAGMPPVAGTVPPERRRGVAIAGGLLALLLVAALGGYFLFMGDDGDDDDDILGVGAATASAAAATAETEATKVAAQSTKTAVPDVATATVVVAVEDTPVVEAPTATATPLPAMVIYYAYKPQDEHNPQIYVMNLDGTESRVFAESRGHSWAPIASPDGSALFFSSVTREDHTIHTPDGGGLVGSGNHDIYVVDILGTNQASLRSANLENITDPLMSWDNGWSWTVDGEWITLTSDRPDSTGGTDWEIYLMRPDGSDVRQLTDTAFNEGWPVWTPDGTQIVYSSDETGDAEIYIMNADGTNPRQLTDRPGSVDLYPSVSPDGTRIVFSSQIPDGNEGNIWIMNLDGSDLQQLTSTAALNNIPSWCPAGDLIVYVSDVRGNDNIYIMNADGSGVKQLTEEPEVITDKAPENTTPNCSFLPSSQP